MLAFFAKYKKFILYFGCSLATMVLEMIMGWFLLRLYPDRIVLTNIVAVVVSALIHYLLTLALVFRLKKNYKSAAVYVLTFFLGIVLQNAIIWVFYEHLLENTPAGVRYFASKVFSLGIPFVFLYYLRSKLNSKISQINHSLEV